MNCGSVTQRIGRVLMAGIFAIAAVSLTSPETAYAKHGNGAAIALGVISGTLAGAAIASSTAPGYYAAPPTYYYPPAPPAYYVAPAPVYSYVPPPAVHYLPVPYYGPGFYYSDD